MKTILTAAAAVCLTACAVQQRGTAATAAYVTARDAGCSSGYVAAGHPWYRFTKDTPRYLADPAYKSDWDDGFAVCKGQYEAVGRAAIR